MRLSPRSLLCFMNRAHGYYVCAIRYIILYILWLVLHTFAHIPVSMDNSVPATVLCIVAHPSSVCSLYDVLIYWRQQCSLVFKAFSMILAMDRSVTFLTPKSCLLCRMAKKGRCGMTVNVHIVLFASEISRKTRVCWVQGRNFFTNYKLVDGRGSIFLPYNYCFDTKLNFRPRSHSLSVFEMETSNFLAGKIN